MPILYEVKYYTSEEKINIFSFSGQANQREYLLQSARDKYDSLRLKEGESVFLSEVGEFEKVLHMKAQ